MGPQSFLKAGHPVTRGTSSRVGQSRSHEPPTADVTLQTSSQTSKKLVSGQEAIVQETPMRGGPAVTGKGPGPVVKTLPLCSKPVGVNHPDTSTPAQEDVSLPYNHTAAVPLPSSLVLPQLEPAPASSGEPLQSTANEHVPRDVNRPCVDATSLSCIARDSPNPFLSSPCGSLLTPSRPSYKAMTDS
ncbi:hypothetical protein AZE42_10466 [Rhizopogon vesiculosus]|uniref:Uncharacterized protein n=1 Tax=Rhizopogon vesiculosus TaxID=180088 RepID=A0A1J8Q9Y7_9AGAM|nr:hypothetical protein AZE42_10466 [Rhizopogon vesiculosus]